MKKAMNMHRIGVEKLFRLLLIFPLLGILSGCNSTPTLLDNATQHSSMSGKASHTHALQYGINPKHYKQISVTEFAAQGFIALHQYLPIGTQIQIINPRTHRKSRVIISGKPAKQHRQQLVLSQKAARKLGLNHRKREKVLYKVLPKKVPYLQTTATDAPIPQTKKGMPLLATSNQASKQLKNRSLTVVNTYSGNASYYAHRFHGRTTANGERYNMHAMTAAHKKLPFNTKVRVTNQQNGRALTLRINDRGPYIKGRIIDVSLAAAKKLGMMKKGVVPVKVEVLEHS
jgi:rare lipoprotein A